MFDDDTTSQAATGLANTPFGDAGYSYAGDHVASRFASGEPGSSQADDPDTGRPVDQGDGLAMAPASRQGGSDDKQRREDGSNPIVGLVGHWWRGGIVAQQADNHGITLARAGAPTDPGRLPMAVLRDGTAPEAAWGQLDDGMGIKHESASPLAYTLPMWENPVQGGLPSPTGGAQPVQPAVDPLQLNTFRVPPTPWDAFNYVGGPWDG